MQIELPTLFVLHEDAAFAASMQHALRSAYRIEPVADWGQLMEAFRRSMPNSIAVVSPYVEAHRGRPSLRLRELLEAFPSSPVVAAFHVTDDRISDTRLVTRWGVAEIVDLTSEAAPGLMRRRIDSARTYRTRVVLEGALPRFVSTRARALITAAAEVVAMGGHAPDLAAKLQIGERTLLRWCHAYHLPQPRRLLAWLRLLVAADMLCEGNRTITAVARACGYATDTSLRNAFRNVADTTAAEVRRHGAAATVAAPFTDELAGLRGSKRKSLA